MDPSSRPRSRWPLVLSFGVITLVFAAADVVAMQRTARIRAEVRTSTSSVLLGLEMVSQLDHDVAMERVLVSQHVYEHRQHAMADLEQRIGRLVARQDATARSFAAVAVWPGEPEAVQQLLAQLEGLRAPTGVVLALSRQLHDAEAAAQLMRLEARFDAANLTLRGLAQISQEATTSSQRRIERLHHDSTLQQAALALVGILWTLVVGVISVRLVDRRESELARYAGMLVERNRELDAFAARVAHDLRGPLNAVSLAGSAMARRAPSVEALGMAHQRGVARMEGIIRDLLALSRAGSSGERCDIEVVVAAVRADFAERVRREGARLEVELSPGEVQVSDGLLAQVLGNLLDNGLKYRRPEAPARLLVHGHVDDGFYVVRVTDHGIGMTPDEVAHLFQPFYRAGRAAHTPGTGLGLTIVKRVAEAAGGAATVESALGRGSTFTLRLPLARREPPGDQRM